MGRPAPKFWWDFIHENGNVVAIIVQSDYPGGEELERMPLRRGQDNESQMQIADQMIADLTAGRRIPNWRKP